MKLILQRIVFVLWYTVSVPWMWYTAWYLEKRHEWFLLVCITYIIIRGMFRPPFNWNTKTPEPKP